MTFDAATGVWSFTTPLPAGTWSYAFKVTPCDGCRPQIPDPANLTFNMTGVFTYTGTYPQWSQVYVPQDPAFGTADKSVEAVVTGPRAGKTEIRRYASPGATTCATIVLCTSPADQHDIAVYTPPAYDPNRAAPYPTLYISHGGSGSEADWPTQGAASSIIDNLILTGKLQPIVVVSTNYNGLPRINGSQEEGYAQDMMKNLIPFMEANYNVSKKANDRAFGGLSAGGGMGGRILFNYPTVFGYYGIWSSTGAFGPTIDMSHPDARTRLALHVGIGKQDPGTARWQGLDRLATTDIPFVRTDFNGVHAWEVWRQELAYYAANLTFRHTTTALAEGADLGALPTKFVIATVVNSTTEPARPTGKVQFYIDGQQVDPARPLLPDGTAKLNVTRLLSTGQHTITAVYSGDRFYNTSKIDLLVTR